MYINMVNSKAVYRLTSNTIRVILKIHHNLKNKKKQRKNKNPANRTKLAKRRDEDIDGKDPEK